MFLYKLKRLAREYFSFTRAEKRGMIILGVILLIAIFIDLIAGHMKPGRKPDIGKWSLFLKSADTLFRAEEITDKTLFTFDPNTIQEARLDSLNIPQVLKNNLMRYRSKGGTFKKPEEIRKLYGMNDSLFTVILPFVNIEIPYNQAVKAGQKDGKNYFNRSDSNKLIVKEKPDSGYKVLSKETHFTVEINSADSATLTRLPGIGPVFAGRIVRFRKSLGGFNSVGQLMEVYGMREENFELFKDYIKTDPALIKQIRINFADVRDLEIHPYISGSQAKMIVDLRSSDGSFISLSKLEERGIFDKQSFERIKYYLTCR